jgi:hypothetical protein
MRMIDMHSETSVKLLQLYLTPKEALEFRKELDRLITNPEANEHSHIYSEDTLCELSFSILTETKLKNIRSYTKLEQNILTGKKQNV